MAAAGLGTDAVGICAGVIPQGEAKRSAMKIEPVFKTKLEIGKFYSVPTVYGLFGIKFDNWPVLGPMHDDKEIIGFPYVHYHYDFRFFNPTQWAFALRWTNDRPHAMIMSYVPDKPDTKPGVIIFRRRKYQREYPQFPVELKTKKNWMGRLEDKYRDATMENWTCPHKGASLRGLPIDEAGCVTCPLHGLRWDLETGCLEASG